MRRIVLASKSKARQDLLRQIGLKVTVSTSSVKERRSIGKSCSDLVVCNAARKAKSVAKRFKSGVVIGADTVVIVGKKIIGKPKSYKGALETLMLLSKRPQWVYTGVAVIDIDNDKMLTSYEKTKVYMQPLTEDEIRDYFKRVSPLDKAGGFDIQGLGSIFIDRIEGCFYNVVGLPLAKLAKVLRKAGINIFKSGACVKE